MDDLEDTAELSILEYARLCGLTRESAQYEVQELPAWYEIVNDAWIEFADPESTVTFELPTVLNLQEKLSIGGNAGQLLASVASLGAQQGPLDIDEHYHPRPALLYLEAPLLKTDPELDSQRFGRKICPPLNKEDFELAQVNVEQDEGLEWSSALFKLRDEYEERSKSEKLDLSREALICIQSAIKDDSTLLGRKTFVENELKYQRNPILEPVTPPLFPLTPDFVCSSSPITDVIKPLELSSQTTVEIEALEHELHRQDVDELEHDAEELVASHFLDEPTRRSSSPVRERVADLKVSDPLSPASVMEVDLESDSLEGVMTQQAPWEEVDMDVDVNNIFKDLIEPFGDAANKQMNYEKLQEADSTIRVDVPTMDFPLPVPSWEQCSTAMEVEEDLRDLMQPIAMLSLHHWPSVSKLECKMPWSPFPARLGQTALEERIKDDVVDKFLKIDGQKYAVNHDSLSWKPPGLMILRDEENEEELRPAPFPKEQETLETLLNKRRIELEYRSRDGRMRTQDHSVSIEQSAAAEQLQTDAESTSMRQMPKPSTSQPNISNVSSTGSIFSTSSEIDRFLIAQGIPLNNTKTPDMVLLPPNPAERSRPSVSRPTSTHFPKLSSAKSSLLLPLPSQSSTTQHIVVSTTILVGQRSLMRRIRQLQPSVKLIEREFADPFAVQDPQPRLYVCLEADIAVSPSTGIICTTLQKIKQKALPGQKTRSPIKETIIAVAPLYEHLMVLVSQNQDCITAIDDRDSDALAELETFATQIDAKVSLLFVHGGEENLARSIVTMITAHSATASGPSLLAEQTLWEMFLRRSGMNSYAAQVVLSELKAVGGEGEGQSQEGSTSSFSTAFNSSQERKQAWGLPAFVLMSADERVERFEKVLGGRRVLQRVSEVLDSGWKS